MLAVIVLMSALQSQCWQLVLNMVGKCLSPYSSLFKKLMYFNSKWPRTAQTLKAHRTTQKGVSNGSSPLYVN